MSEFNKGHIYLTVAPGTYVNELKVIKATQSIPATMPGDAVLVKVKLRVDKAAFKALPVEIDVHEESVSYPAEIYTEDIDVESEVVP